MILTLFGPPGSGKGTQAGTLCRRFHLKHLATGDLLRAEIRARTPLGLEVQAIMARGDLVSDAMVLALVEKRLVNGTTGGTLLDGFPRNLQQLDDFDRSLATRGISMTLAISLRIDDALLIGRLTGRRVCTDCNRSFNVQTHPPEVSGICDDCGGILVQRDDDKEGVIAHRLSEYHAQTRPILGALAERGILVEIDAARPIDEVRNAMFRAVDERRARIGRERA